MDKLMITHGNGEQLSLMLNELRGDAHLEMEEEFYSLSKDSGKTLTKPLPPFEDWIGVYSPSPSDLRHRGKIPSPFLMDYVLAGSWSTCPKRTWRLCVTRPFYWLQVGGVKSRGRWPCHCFSEIHVIPPAHST
eukprot:scaffold15532_cov73-Cylindrotheca_fusiformis.AAC.1